MLLTTAHHISFANNSFLVIYIILFKIKGGRMGRSDKVSLWCVSLLINTKIRFFILE